MLQPDNPAGATLTREEVLDWASRARANEDELDLRGYDLSGIDLDKANLEDIVFGRHERHGPPPATLVGASFRESTLEHCFFAHARLSGADFRGSRLSRCDLRYADFHRTTLEEAHLVLCDLYRATIRQGTVMLNTTFELVSLTASLEGSTDLRWESFRKAARPGLVTEDEIEYPHFLEFTKNDRRQAYPSEAAIERRFVDAARTYRNLSALWTSRGQFGDAGDAYVHSRRLERDDAQRKRRCDNGAGPSRAWRLWAWLWLADLLCAFGTSLWRIVPWLAAVALVPGFVYAALGGVSGAHDVLDTLLYSFNQLTDAVPHGMASASSAVDLVGGIQRVLGVALLGLFGFVLGSKIRSS